MKPQIQISIKPVPLDVCLDQNFRREAYAMESMYRAAPALYEALQYCLEAANAHEMKALHSGKLFEIVQEKSRAALAQADGVSCL